MKTETVREKLLADQRPYREIAEDAKLSVSFVFRLRAGYVENPNPKVLDKLAQAMNVKIRVK